MSPTTSHDPATLLLSAGALIAQAPIEPAPLITGPEFVSLSHDENLDTRLDAEAKRMRDEAAANADSDKADTERITKMNAADSMIFQTEKQLKEYGDKLSGGNKTAVEGALADLKKAHESKDLGAIDTAMTAINTAWQAASQEMYAAGDLQKKLGVVEQAGHLQAGVHASGRPEDRLGFGVGHRLDGLADAHRS